MLDISVTILVKNNEKTLEETLQSTVAFPEVILFDTGSTDRTLDIAKKFSNVKIINGTFNGFGPTHNAATKEARHDFILSIDSDEVLSKELVEELKKIPLEKNCLYAIERHNYFRGKWIRGCAGWYPDFVVRLYNRRETSFDNAQVHEKIIQKPAQKIQKLQHPMKHVPYREMFDFLQKMQCYTTLFAEQNKGLKKSSFARAIFHGIAAFVKSYFLKKGICLGKEGFIISLYNGHTAFYKYLKLWELNTR